MVTTETHIEQMLIALEAGANEYIMKPFTADVVEDIPKIKQFFEAKKIAAAPHLPSHSVLPHSASARSVPSTVPVHHPGAPLFTMPAERKIVAIGVSTGGPTALMEILPLFPASFPLPVVIVQHMPPLFTRLLAERLHAQSGFEVIEAADGTALRPGRVVLAPGDYHMRLHRSAKEVSVKLDQGPRENSCRPAVDVLFRSVAEVYAGGVIAVILTGMGQDGLRGAEQLKSKGAYVIAQDQSSSVVWGMPGAVVEAGLADSVLSLHAVVPEILKQVSR
jgi:two-component system chemotaxis response regulator CheB